jgi:hypothetical protein
MVWNLLKYNQNVILFQGFFTFISALLSVAGPYFMRKILTYVEKENASPELALGYAGAIFGVGCLN